MASLSSIIVAQLTGAEWFDSRKFIKTEKKHSKHVLDTELTNSLVRETFSSLPKRVLVPGFISTDKMTGEVTNWVEVALTIRRQSLLLHWMPTVWKSGRM